MKLKKLTPLWRGLAAVTATLMTFSVVGYSVAQSYRSFVDGILGTESVRILEGENAPYKKDDATVEAFHARVKKHAIEQGESGFVVMKNDGVLPLAAGKTVALLGAASYRPIMGVTGDLTGGNDDSVDLVKALTDAGYTIEPTLKGIYDTMLSQSTTTSNPWGGTVTTYLYGPTSSLSDMGDYKVNEVPADKFTDPEIGGAATDWQSKVSADIAIVTFSRTGGESGQYEAGKTLDYLGNATGKDPLALSDIELGIVDLAKQLCPGKVIVLLNTGNNMEIAEIAEGGAHEVNAIGYVGIPNDYQFTGIMNVLTGKVNATGAMADTYVLGNNTSLPATVNVGGGAYANPEIAASTNTTYPDSRYTKTLTNTQTTTYGGGNSSYNGENYVVEAEGIYVGYKYFETRYFDSIANADTSNANGTAGSTDGQAWDYHKEVVYSFGHGLSYYDYTQKIQSVKVDLSEDGEISAEIEVTNNSNTKALFLAQLYVSKPYEEGQVEKSAVDFLNSGKIEVDANSSDTITVSIPTKYLASWDSAANNGKGGWILDKGDYIFTAAAGSHAAVNNVLAHLGYGEDIDTDKVGDTKVWNLSNRNETALSVDNGTEVKNAAANADLNYFLPNTVTYLSRSDWQGTYPVNYNTDPITIGGDKVEEWIKEIRNQQYTIKNNEPVADPDGTIPTGFTVTENADGSKTGTWQLIVDALMTADGTLDVDNIDSELWDKVAKSITVDNAIGAVVHGGNRSDELDNLHNPIVLQNEGVNGYTTGYTEEGSDKTYKFNVNSMTLLGSSFDPDLAWEWGVLEGESGLWVQRYDIWGVGLTLRRTPYNGRNFEYASEDPMRTNRVGYGVMGGALTKGSLVGPKHFGFNDQEHFRNGVALYMTEQKVRETDLRGFQGGLDDAKGLAVMVSFSRVGATNVSCHQGLLKQILRDEWGFKGLISTDMNNGNDPYFDAASLIMATVTQVADFGANDQTIVGATGGWSASASWEYLTLDTAKNDATLVNQARQNLKYQLYAFAHSAVVNMRTVTERVWWDDMFTALTVVTSILFAASAGLWIVSKVLPEKKKEEE